MYKMVLDSFRSTTREGDADMYAAEAKRYTSEPGAPKKEENSPSDATLNPPDQPPRGTAPAPSAVPGAGGSGIAPKNDQELEQKYMKNDSETGVSCANLGSKYIERLLPAVCAATVGLSIIGTYNILDRKLDHRYVQVGSSIGTIIGTGIDTLIYDRPIHKMLENSFSSSIGSYFSWELGTYINGKKDKEAKVAGTPLKTELSSLLSNVAYSATGAVIGVTVTQGLGSTPCYDNCGCCVCCG